MADGEAIKAQLARVHDSVYKVKESLAEDYEVGPQPVAELDAIEREVLALAELLGDTGVRERFLYEVRSMRRNKERENAEEHLDYLHAYKKENERL